MFLKSVELYGFKSFSDRTLIEFTEGITALLGPNGSGKSNIVDAIRWVLGSQNRKALRAGSMEDVIFKGSETRPPSQMAEVTLVIDNREDHLPSDLNEITIRRRLFRDGTSEYYLNGSKCLLKNITELFFDTGVGKTSYSVMEQGKIDQILSNRPEDRRELFEEAAGISRSKKRIEEAESSLEKAEQNLREIQIAANASKREYERTKAQAEKAERWKELTRSQLEGDINLSLARVLTITKVSNMRANTVNEARDEIERVKRELNEIPSGGIDLEKMARDRDELSSLTARVASLESEIQGIENSISYFDEAYQDELVEQRNGSDKIKVLWDDFKAKEARRDERKDILSELEERAEEILSQKDYAEKSIKKAKETAREARREILNLEEKTEELSKEIDGLSKELRDAVETLIERLGGAWSPSFNYREERESLIALLSEAETKIKAEKRITDDEVREIIAKASHFIESLPQDLEALMAPSGLLKTNARVREAQDRLQREIEEVKVSLITHRICLAEAETKEHTMAESLRDADIRYAQAEARRSALEAEEERATEEIEKARILWEDESSRDRGHGRKIDQLQYQIRSYEEKAQSLKNELLDARAKADLKNAEFKASMDGYNMRQRRYEELNQRLRELEATVSSESAYIDAIDSQIKDIYTHFYEKYSRNLGEYEERLNDSLPDESVTKERLKEIQSEIESLGQINFAASADFERAEDEWKFYEKQLNDCFSARDAIKEVWEDLNKKSVDLFMEAFYEISSNFQEMFSRLFGGGKAVLTLNSPENVLTSGIDIEVQPPGKAMGKLSLLSGGEKTMTSIALLFATFKVKPSPFCLLDELDAALDQRNIGAFLDVLKEFSEKSQFVIITHNKYTVTGSSSMLGVSQEEAGVSKAVSYRLGSERGRPVIIDDGELNSLEGRLPEGED